MNKVKVLFDKLRKIAFVKAFLLWIVVLVLLALAMDKLVMPIFSGAFASTGEVPNLEGM
ncbi:MAG: hypothetical protein HUK19_06165, partial [Fibrobacter sp.]|nr:hypothetical protein [Fibrobacter sp.]